MVRIAMSAEAYAAIASILPQRRIHPTLQGHQAGFLGSRRGLLRTPGRAPFVNSTPAASRAQADAIAAGTVIARREKDHPAVFKSALNRVEIWGPH
jgi:hypothetical protein